MPKRCLRCGHVYEAEEIKTCENCGYTVFEDVSSKKVSPERRIFLTLLGILIALIAISTFLPVYQNNNTNNLPNIIISASEVSSLISGNWVVLVNETGSFIMYNNGTSRINLLNGSQILSKIVASKLILYPGMIITQGNGVIESLESSNSSIIIILFSPQNSDYINIISNQLAVLNYLNKLNKVSNYTYYDQASNIIIGIISKKYLLVVNSNNLQFKELYQIFSYISGKLSV